MFIINEELGLSIDLSQVVMVRRTASNVGCVVYLQGGHKAEIPIPFDLLCESINEVVDSHESHTEISFELDTNDDDDGEFN